MEFLAQERQTLEHYMPGLDGALAKLPLLELEKRGNSGLTLFREANGPALLITKACHGMGATALEAMRIQRAIASRSPSLAVATTMHHFSVATILEMSLLGSGLESLLLEAIADQHLLVASGFAEGRPNQGILHPTMQGKPTKGGVLVNGSKKPCSLTHSMDLLTASVKIDDGTPDGQMGVAMIPTQGAGIERREFWGSWILAGAESDEVILRDVEVPDSLMFRMGESAAMDATQISGFLWFELLVTASYLGVASALVERVLRSNRGCALERATLGIELEGAMAALEGIAYSMVTNPRDEAELARMLFVRYLVQGAIERSTQQAAELLGGMAFVCSSEVSYLLSAARALAFHPPSKAAIAQELAGHLAGKPLQIQ
ncbi:MAG: acyl-CoA dehydrogenase family protein [Caldilineaceae bacterium]